MRIKKQKSAFSHSVIHKKENITTGKIQPNTALHQEEHGQGCSYLPLLSPDTAAHGVLCPVLGPTRLRLFKELEFGSSIRIAHEVFPAQKSSAEAFSVVLT